MKSLLIYDYFRVLGCLGWFLVVGLGLVRISFFWNFQLKSCGGDDISWILKLLKLVENSLVIVEKRFCLIGILVDLEIIRNYVILMKE